jgi:hypothetical protein
MLVGDPAAQLATIAGTPHWRLIHWSLLFGFPLMLAGVLGLVARHLETPGASLLRSGAVLAVFGFAVWSLNVLLMAGTGWTLAHQYPGDARALFLYDAIHPFGLAAERLATFVMGIATAVVGRGVGKGGVYGRWLAETGTATGLINVAVAVLCDETSQFLYVAQGLLVAWLAVAGLMMLIEARRPATGA